jgi:hypothetical protein
MTTSTKTKACVHSPRVSAISSVGDIDYTFCKTCENNIERFWIFDDYDRLPFATDWIVSK